jgi:multiple sugar transport system substrate-binding protein
MLEAIDAEGEVEYPVIDWEPFWLAYVFMAANGGQIVNEDQTEAAINSPENVEALEFLQGLREDGLLGTDTEVASDDQHAGIGEAETAMVLSGGWIITELKDSYEEIDEVADIAVPPHPEGEEPSTMVLTAGYAVSENSEYIDEAIDLIHYLMGDGIMPWLETGIALSIRESHREEVDLYEEDERYERWFEMSDLPRHTAQEYGPHTEEIVNAIEPQIEGIYQGEVEPEDAVATLEEEINNILD